MNGQSVRMVACKKRQSRAEGSIVNHSQPQAATRGYYSVPLFVSVKSSIYAVGHLTQTSLRRYSTYPSSLNIGKVLS